MTIALTGQEMRGKHKARIHDCPAGVPAQPSSPHLLPSKRTGVQRKGSGVKSILGVSKPTGDSPTKSDLNQPNPDGAGSASLLT